MSGTNSRAAHARRMIRSPTPRPRPVLFCRSTADGRLLWSRDAGDLSPLWSRPRHAFGDSCGELAIGDQPTADEATGTYVCEHAGRVLAISSGQVRCIDTETETEAVVYQAVAGSVIGSRGGILWTYRDGGLQAFDGDGEAGHYPTERPTIARAQQQIRPDGSLVFTDPAGGLTAIRPDGSLLWRDPAASRVIAQYADGDLFVAQGERRSGSTGELIASVPTSWQGDFVLHPAGDPGEWNPAGDALIAQDVAVELSWLAAPDPVLLADGTLLATDIAGSHEFEGTIYTNGYWIKLAADLTIEAVRLYWLNFQHGGEQFGPIWNWHTETAELDTDPEAGDAFRLNYRPDTADQLGDWLDEITLADPLQWSGLAINRATPTRPHHGRPDGSLLWPDESIARGSSGLYFAQLVDDVWTLVAVDPSGAERWRRSLPAGPQTERPTSFVLSSDQSRIYYCQ